MGLDRVRILSTGFAGATGYTNLYFTTATAANLNAVKALFNSFATYLPPVVTYTFPSTGDTIDETDGHLIGGWSAAAPTPLIGGGSGAYAAPAGFMLEWRISGVVDGRRPIAKTFMVPASSAAFGSNGQVHPTLIGLANAGITTFLGSSAGFSLWHRPVKASAGPPPVAARPGGSFPIVSGFCSSKPTVLRSRRD